MDSATSLRYAQNDGRELVVIPREVAESNSYCNKFKRLEQNSFYNS